MLCCTVQDFSFNSLGAAAEEEGWSNSWLCFGSIWMLNVLIVCCVGHRVLCKDMIRRRLKKATAAAAADANDKETSTATAARDDDCDDDFDLLISSATPSDKKRALQQQHEHEKFWRLKSAADRCVRNGNHLQAFMSYRQCLSCLDRYADGSQLIYSC